MSAEVKTISTHWQVQARLHDDDPGHWWNIGSPAKSLESAKFFMEKGILPGFKKRDKAKCRVVRIETTETVEQC